MADLGAVAVVARRTVFAVAIAAAAVAFAEHQPYDRYNSIVIRQMFGPLPPNFDPTKSPADVAKSAGSASEKELTKEQEKVKSSIRFSVINVTPEGETAVGFTDNSDPKKPVHYYLKVGESKGGWEVKEADAKAATMTVAKDDIEVTLSLGGDSSKGAGTDKAESAKPPANGPSRSGLLVAGGSLRARRMAQLEQIKQQEEADRQKRLADEKAREEARAQREAEEKARREAEQEENRKQLEQIREEIRKAREEQQTRGKNTPAQDGESASESE